VAKDRAQRTKGTEPKETVEGGGADMVRSRTRTGRDALYIEVTSAQGEVIRQKAKQEGKAIKDVLIDSVLTQADLEAKIDSLESKIGLLESKCTMYSDFLHDVQAALVGASTERALTREEAQLFLKANELTRSGRLS